MKNRVHNIVPTFCLVCLSLSVMQSPAIAAEPASVVLDSLTVIAIENVDVPAMRSGRIMAMNVAVGDKVEAGQTLGSLDDQEAMIAVELAKTELAIAHARTMDDTAVDYATAKQTADRRRSRQQQIVHRIADQQAENNTQILAARKAEAVSKNEWDRAAASRQAYSESVSQSEIEGLRLAYDKSRLETKQSEFEQRIAVLQAQAESEAAKRFEANMNQSVSEVAAAKLELDINRLQSLARKQQLELAEANVQQLRFVAPFPGTVVTRHCDVGSWVGAGEPVVKLIRLDRLRLEAYLPLDRLAAIDEGMKAEIEINSGSDTLRKTGEVTFVSPIVDPINQEVQVWVEFDNNDSKVKPGMLASVTLKSQAVSTEVQP